MPNHAQGAARNMSTPKRRSGFLTSQPGAVQNPSISDNTRKRARDPSSDDDQPGLFARRAPPLPANSVNHVSNNPVLPPLSDSTPIVNGSCSVKPSPASAKSAAQNAESRLKLYKKLRESQTKHVQSLNGSVVSCELDVNSDVLQSRLETLQATYSSTPLNTEVDNAPFKRLEKVHMLSNKHWYNSVVIAVAHTDHVLWAMSDDEALSNELIEKRLFPIPGLGLTLKQFQTITQLPSYQKYCYAVTWCEPYAAQCAFEWCAEPAIRHGWLAAKKNPTPEAPSTALAIVGGKPTLPDLRGDKPAGYEDKCWPPEIRKAEELWEMDDQEKAEVLARQRA